MALNKLNLKERASVRSIKFSLSVGQAEAEQATEKYQNYQATADDDVSVTDIKVK